MKKKFIVVLVVLLSITLFLSACGSSEKTSNDKGDSAKNSAKTLRVVTAAEYAPFEYMDKGEIVGFDADLVNAVAKEAGLNVKIEHVGWDPIFVEIEKERADLSASAITINDERKESYDFSVPYFLSTQMIMVKEGSTIKAGKDLKDKKIAVQNATTGQATAESIQGKNSENIKKFENITLAIMEMKNGGVDAVIADNSVVEEYVKNNPNDKLVVLKDDTFAKEYFGYLFPKGSKLKADWDAAVKKVMNNGTYTKIYKEWFGAEPDLETLKAQQ